MINYKEYYLITAAFYLNLYWAFVIFKYVLPSRWNPTQWLTKYVQVGIVYRWFKSGHTWYGF